MPATLSPEMGKAVSRLEQISADDAARMRYEARQLYLLDELARTNAAVDENKRETAINFLSMGFSVEQVAKGTKLSIQEVENLKAQESLSHAL